MDMGALLLPLLGGLVLFAIISAIVRAPGQALNAKFVRLGTLRGRTKDEIIRVVGRPNAISAAPDECHILQWMQTGYHIALRFDRDGICTGVTHESRG